MQQTLHRAYLPDVHGIHYEYYVLTDADGTRHQFTSIGSSMVEYEDTSGLELKLVVNGMTVTST